MFFVLEIQKLTNGKYATLVTQKETQNEAESVFHSVLASAAISEIPRKGAVIVDDDCRLIAGKMYQHGEFEPQS